MGFLFIDTKINYINKKITFELDKLTIVMYNR